MRISLCLLVWNEIKGCEVDVPILPRDEFDEVYAVDGGSTDGSVEYLESMNIPVYKQPLPGLNAAYIHAVEMSKCDAVVVFFPKGTISPLTLKSFRQYLQDGYGLVIASRNIKGGHNEEDDRILKPRKWGVSLLSMFASAVWRREGNKVKDILHGYKGFSVAAFNKMAIAKSGLSIDIEMVIRAYRLKIPRIEFAVRESSRGYANTHFKILPTARKLANFLVKELLRTITRNEI